MRFSRLAPPTRNCQLAVTSQARSGVGHAKRFLPNGTVRLLKIKDRDFWKCVKAVRLLKTQQLSS